MLSHPALVIRLRRMLEHGRAHSILGPILLVVCEATAVHRELP